MFWRNMLSSPTFKMEAAYFPDPSVLIYHTTYHHIPELLTPVLLHGSGCLYNQQHDTTGFVEKLLESSSRFYHNFE
jgi:hypothetical protein